MHVLRERGVIRRVVSNHKTHFVSENNYHTETSVTIITDTKLRKAITTKIGRCCRGKGGIQVVVGGKLNHRHKIGEGEKKEDGVVV